MAVLKLAEHQPATLGTQITGKVVHGMIEPKAAACAKEKFANMAALRVVP